MSDERRVTIMVLVENDRIKLDDPVSGYRCEVEYDPMFNLRPR